MQDSFTPRLQLPYLAAAQAQKHVTLNEALAGIDGLVQSSVVSASQMTQPDDPLDGQMWLLPEDATGTAWQTMRGRLSRYEAGGWRALPLVEGHIIHIQDEKALLLYGAGDWIDIMLNPPAPCLNRLTNGSFNIWQRGSTVACPADQTTFTADRWQVWSAGASSTVMQIAGEGRSATVAGLHLSANGNVASAAISQTIEKAMIADLAGERVVLSGIILPNSGRDVGLNLYAFGAPDQPSTRVNAGWVSLGSFTTDGDNFEQSFVLPEGFANGGQIEFSLGALSAGQDVVLAALQLERGPRRHRPETFAPGVELARCQRYYQQTPPLYGLVGSWSTPTTAVLSANLAVPMRSTPRFAPVSDGSVTVDCGDVGSASTRSFVMSGGPANIVMHAAGLDPPRTAGGCAGCNTQIACDAEL